MGDQETVEFTNAEAQTAYACLLGGTTAAGKTIAGQLDREDLVGPVQYRLSRLAQELAEIGKAIEAAGKGIRKQFAMLDDDGEIVLQKDKEGNPVPGQPRVDPDRWDEFVAATEALAETKNTIPWVALEAKLLYGVGKKTSVPGGGRVFVDLAPFLDFTSMNIALVD